MAAKTPDSGSISQSATATITGINGMDMATLHCITIHGTGVVSISLRHLGQTTYTTYATGVSSNTDTYVMKGCTGVKIVENGTGSVTYSYIPHD